MLHAAAQRLSTRQMAQLTLTIWHNTWARRTFCGTTTLGFLTDDNTLASVDTGYDISTGAALLRQSAETRDAGTT
jgi:hypothetical protein